MRSGSQGLLAFLVFLGLTLLTIDLRTGGEAFAGARAVVAAVIGPLQVGVGEVANPALDRELVAENEQLRAELAATEGQRARLAELEALLGLAEEYDLVAAQIVAFDPARGAGSSATIDRGSRDGVAQGAAALAAGGLAGRVELIAQRSAVVRFVTDPGFAVGGRLASAGSAGIARGTGGPLLEFELLDPTAEVAVGDVVLTVGSVEGGPYPAGIPIGKVVDPGDPAAARRTVLLDPPATLDKVSILAVLRGVPR